MFKNAHPGKAGGAFLTFCRRNLAGVDICSKVCYAESPMSRKRRVFGGAFHAEPTG